MASTSLRVVGNHYALQSTWMLAIKRVGRQQYSSCYASKAIMAASSSSASSLSSSFYQRSFSSLSSTYASSDPNVTIVKDGKVFERVRVKRKRKVRLEPVENTVHLVDKTKTPQQQGINELQYLDLLNRQERLRTLNLPKIRAGDIVRIIQRESLLPNSPVQTFMGIVLDSRNTGLTSSIRLRNILAGVDVEYRIPLYSPLMVSVTNLMHIPRFTKRRIYWIRNMQTHFSVWDEHKVTEVLRLFETRKAQIEERDRKIAAGEEVHPIDIDEMSKEWETLFRANRTEHTRPDVVLNRESAPRKTWLDVVPLMKY